MQVLHLCGKIFKLSPLFASWLAWVSIEGSWEDGGWEDWQRLVGGDVLRVVYRRTEGFIGFCRVVEGEVGTRTWPFVTGSALRQLRFC